MESPFLLTEIIQIYPYQLLGQVYLDWMPQAGDYIELSHKMYAVLERHHHYQYRHGRYCLEKIALSVQTCPYPIKKSLYKGRWVIGDSRCRYNAHSEILRCAINPDGSCHDCCFFEEEV